MTDVPVIVSDTDDGRDVPDSDVVWLAAPGSDVIYPVSVARYWTLMQRVSRWAAAAWTWPEWTRGLNPSLGRRIQTLSENNKPGKRKSRNPCDCFQFDETPENVALIIMNTNPKKRGEWDFEKRD